MTGNEGSSLLTFEGATVGVLEGMNEGDCVGMRVVGEADGV